MSGWVEKTLGEVCRLKSGTTVKKALERPSGDIPYLKVADMSFPGNEVEIYDSSRFLDGADVRESSILPVGTTIFPKRGGAILTNKKRLTAVPICADLNIMGVTPSGLLTPRFLYYYFINVDMRELGSGSSIPQINNYDIEPLPISYPPLPEQERIVAILDEAFAAIATATANAKKNLANARELFESELRVEFTPANDGWENETVGEVSTLKSGATLKKNLEMSDGDIPYLKVADMTVEGNETRIYTSSRFLGSESVREKMIIPVGSTIFPKRGGAILTNKKRLTAVPICADLNIMAVIPSERLAPEFLYFYFLGVDMRILGSGSSIPQINYPDISPLPISFPKSIDAQESIITKLNELSSEILSIEAMYARKTNLLVDLKQSILHKAFTGELTADTKTVDRELSAAGV
jgi:type I restriction enzyme S subunit